ncbi:MAG: macromolecule metabolism protein [Verrucomicrobiaceae bacterium]|nr:macromolecule metabolism protein [Verrucomicrobiaceae bacterium]
MLTRSNKIQAAFIAGLIGFSSLFAKAADIPYRGVNLSSAESGGCTKPAKYGFKYVYPSNAIIDYFLNLGMNTFRVPFCWERLQISANAELDSAELGHLDQMISYTNSKGAYVILDPHNYATYWGKLLGSGTDNSAFADFWSRLATHYRDNDHVIFGLMNEPHGISSESWLTSANAAIAAIRKTGAKNLILVPGTAWTGAHSWAKTSYGTPNSVSMLNVKDPANNYAYEVHQYFDKDSSGTTAECLTEDVGAKRLSDFNAWLAANNKKAFLGEFGAARSAICYSAVDNLLQAIHQQPTLWLGWTYWSAGPWLGNYMFALPLQATPGVTSQLDVLKKYLGKAADCNITKCAQPAPPKLNPPEVVP